MRSRSGGYRALLRKGRDRNDQSAGSAGSAGVEIDYKDVRLLSGFLSERGKIVPSRITAISKKHQRRLSLAIKRARKIALLPYVNK